MLVSPELVHPLEPEEAPLILPGMEVTEPGDWPSSSAETTKAIPTASTAAPSGPPWSTRTAMARLHAKRQADCLQSEDYYVHGQHGFSR